MNKKNILIASLSALFLVLALILFFNLATSQNRQDLDKPLDSKTPGQNSVELLGMEGLDYEVREDTALRARFEKYTKDNISELSPEEAVLGGTFYVTNIKWLNNNSAIVDYEDGHIALQALAKYNLDDEGEVEIVAFEIIPEEDTNNSSAANEGSMDELTAEINFIKKSDNVENKEDPKYINVEVSLPDFEPVDW